jgi:hypothetical protein
MADSGEISLVWVGLNGKNSRVGMIFVADSSINHIYKGLRNG